MTLYGDFLDDGPHRRSHKWLQYFPAYERHLERFRNRHVTLFEIGVSEGGSVTRWKRYLGPFVTIVGIDILDVCRQLEDDQIHIRIGSQDDPGFLRSLVEEFGSPDIVIDDGSHIQQHINTSFETLYPHVAKNGIYLVEDLHAAYWPNHGAGLRHPDSFIERAKAYVDEIHAEYTGNELPRTALGDRTTSIHFYDSVIVLEVGEYRPKRHRMSGEASLFRYDWTPGSPNPPATAAPAAPAPVTAPTPPAQIVATEDARAMRAQIEHLEREVRALRESTSWRLTAPMRNLSRLMRGGA
jgi:hypothetical protein